MNLRNIQLQSCLTINKLFSMPYHMFPSKVVWLLLLGFQWLGAKLVVIIANLTPRLSFGHDSQFKVQNGNFKLKFDIFILKIFQWYKHFLVKTKFTHCTFVPKDWNTERLPTPKLGIYLANPKVCFLFIPPRCLGIFLALICSWFVSFLPCPNFNHDLRPRSQQLSR